MQNKSRLGTSPGRLFLYAAMNALSRQSGPLAELRSLLRTAGWRLSSGGALCEVRRKVLTVS